jgi:O-antigen/teichoic acid export membrane protein
LGCKISMIVSFLIGMPFELVWGAYAFEIEKKEFAKEIFAKILTYVIILSVFIALSISVLSKEIITIMASPSFIGAYVIIPLITTSIVLQISTNVVRIGILIKRKTFYLPVISSIIALLNVILNFALTPRYGMIGAAAANVLSFSVFPLMSYLISHRLYPIRFEFSRIFKIVSIALGIYLISLLASGHGLWQSIFLKVILVAMFPITLLLFGFFEQTEKEHISKAAIIIRESFMKIIPFSKLVI